MGILGRVLGGLAAGMISSARRKKNSSSSSSSSGSSSRGSGGSSTFPGGPTSSGGSSSGTSPYGANTNWDNERNYLNSLVSKGGGNGIWAKNQLSALDAAQKQYGNQQTTQTQGPSVSLPQFQYPTYQEYQEDMPQYESPYSDRIDSILNDVLNRDKFSYSVEDDPLYDQYKAQYMREGQRAMQDTLASTAANAGGMNSYAVSAAQQANNYYNSKMADAIPELYNAAYQKYLNEIDQKVQDLGILNQMDSNQYNRFRTTLDDWRGDRDFTRGLYQDQLAQYNTDRNFDYQAGRDQIGDQRYDTEWNHSTTQEKKNEAYNRVMEILSSGAMPDSTTLEEAGISPETANSLLTQFQLTLAAQRAKSTGSSKSRKSSKSGRSSAGNYVYGNGGDDGTSAELYNTALNTLSNVPGLSGLKSVSQGSGSNPLTSIPGFGPTFQQTARDYASGGVDSNSLLDLGYGPISYDELLRLIKSGQIYSQEK